MKIGILTDSTSDLSAEIIRKYDIEVIPLTVQVNNKTYKDGVELSSENFFDKISDKEQLQKLPTTSQPNIEAFKQKYENMFSKYDFVISIHLAAALSGTYEVANIAAQQFFDQPEDNIKIIDSKSASLGLGYQVLLTAKMIEKGKDIKEIVKTLNRSRDNLDLYFNVYDLQFLKEGGRIGKAKALLGSILNLNPLLKLDSNSGKILPHDKVRGTSKTIKKMVDLALNDLKDNDNVWLGLLKGNEDKYWHIFQKSVDKKLKDINIKNKYKILTNISPVLGAHVGPYVYGIIKLKGEFLDNG